MEQNNQNPNPYYDRPDSYTENSNVFYNRPGQSTGSSSQRRQIEPPNSLARASMIIGGVALVSVFTFTVIPAVILGALALLLALLSRGGSLKFHPTAKTAAILSALAIGANVAMVGGVFGILFGDSPMHDELNATYEEMFGMTYDEILKGAMDGSLDIDDLYEQMYENMY